ncbi:MAG: hypothetical protein IPK32_07265 [Verrucomicrobiaceae bacterium]|nr:hypothetical protein [Verrucomicrobiaceae bacterium]
MTRTDATSRLACLLLSQLITSFGFFFTAEKPTYAQNFLFWDSNGNGHLTQKDGSSNWNPIGKREWWNGASNVNWDNASDSIAVFGNGNSGGIAGVITVTHEIQAQGIRFETTSGSYTLQNTAGNSIILGDAGILASTSATVHAQVTLAEGQSWEVANSERLVFGGTIIGSVPLEKSGEGCLVFTAASPAMSGTVTVSSGTLQVLNASGSATGTGAVFVGNAATLEGTGSIAGPVQVNAGGSVAPGYSGSGNVGTLTFNGGLLLAGGASAHFQLGSVSSFDRLVINGALSLSSTTQLMVGVMDGFVPQLGQSFDLLDWGTLNFSEDKLDTCLVLPNISAHHLAWDTSLFQESGAISITTAAPEPGRTCLSLLGILCILNKRRWH